MRWPGCERAGSTRLTTAPHFTPAARTCFAVPHGADGRKRRPGAGAARAVNWLAHVAAEQKGDFLILLGFFFARTRSPRAITQARLKPKHKKQRLGVNPANNNEPRKKKFCYKFFLGDLISVMGLGVITGRCSCYKFLHTFVGSVLVGALAHPH